jgi:hypothetical protein
MKRNTLSFIRNFLDLALVILKILIALGALISLIAKNFE